MEAVAARKTISRRAAGPLRGTVVVPGDRAIGHRALLLGALASGETRIEGLPGGNEMLRTAAALRALGADVAQDADGAWRIAGRGIGGLTEPNDVLQMGNASDAAWLLCGILASHPIFATLTGDWNLRRTPMDAIVDPLSACGARFTARNGGRRNGILLPLAVEGAADALPLDYRAATPSARVKSALLLAGLNARGMTRIEEPEATHDHTETMLRHFGATVHVEITGAGRTVTLGGQPELRAADIIVPGDPSAAAFPLVAALLVPGSILTLPGIALNPFRTGLFATLAEMGADIAIQNHRIAGGEPIGDLVATHGLLRGVDVPADSARRMTEDYPILAVAAAAAVGETRLRGLKNASRVAATASMLAVNGISVEIEGDDLIVHGVGRPLAGDGAGHPLAGDGAGRPVAGDGLVETKMDCRIGMAGLVLGMISQQPITVDTARFPEFIARMNAVGASMSAL